MEESVKDWRPDSTADLGLSSGEIGASVSEFDSIIRKARLAKGGWLFDAFRYQVVHAPTFWVWAPDDQLREIIRAIEEYQARRVHDFETSERAQDERLGWPENVINMMAPKPGYLLDAAYVPLSNPTARQ